MAKFIALQEESNLETSVAQVKAKIEADQKMAKEAKIKAKNSQPKPVAKAETKKEENPEPKKEEHQSLVQKKLKSSRSADEFDNKSQPQALVQSDASEVADDADGFDHADEVANVEEGVDEQEDDEETPENPSEKVQVQADTQVKQGTDAYAYKILLDRLRNHPELIANQV